MSTAAQLVLFAPDCGGVSRAQDLSEVLQILGRGALQWLRSVAGSYGHSYELRWNGVAAGMERLECQLRFPGYPEGDVDIAVTTH